MILSRLVEGVPLRRYLLPGCDGVGVKSTQGVRSETAETEMVTAANFRLGENELLSEPGIASGSVWD